MSTERETDPSRVYAVMDTSGPEVTIAQPAPAAGDAVTAAIALAGHPTNDLERVAMYPAILPHLQPGETVDTGAMRILAADLAAARAEAEEATKRDTAHREMAALQLANLSAKLAAKESEAAALRGDLEEARGLVARIIADLKFRAQFRDEEQLDLSHGLVLEADKFRNGTAAGTGWLPIETAPRDGSYILVTWSDNPQWVSSAFFCDGQWVDPGDFDDEPLYQPTHWRPLPPPPAEEGGGL